MIEKRPYDWYFDSQDNTRPNEESLSRALKRTFVQVKTEIQKRTARPEPKPINVELRLNTLIGDLSKPSKLIGNIKKTESQNDQEVKEKKMVIFEPTETTTGDNRQSWLSNSFNGFDGTIPVLEEGIVYEAVDRSIQKDLDKPIIMYCPDKDAKRSTHAFAEVVKIDRASKTIVVHKLPGDTKPLGVNEDTTGSYIEIFSKGKTTRRPLINIGNLNFVPAHQI